MRHLGDAVHLGEYRPGSDEWEELRRRRIGGSEISAVMGFSPWESAFSLWHRKAGIIGPPEETDLMWWGTHNEPTVALRFAKLHPEYDVRRAGTYVNRDRDYQLLSPDRVLFRRGAAGRWDLLEIKQAHDSEDWGEEGSDDIPMNYKCQGIWACDTFGRDRIHFAVYFGGDRYREYVLHYDEGDAIILRKRAEEFLASVAAGATPEIDGHRATYDAVRAMHPDISDEEVVIPDRIALPYLAALEGEKAAKEEKTRMTAILADYVGGARRAIYGETKAKKPRTLATRIASAAGVPYLRAAPRPKPDQSIAAA